jgi:hypothetical protein
VRRLHRAQGLEVVLGVSVYVLSTFVNIATGAELDAPFAAFAWEPPARRVFTAQIA